MLKEGLPYFYMLPKLHKQPIGMRPVAACQNSVLEIPNRVLSQCLKLVQTTLRKLHSAELQQTGLRKWWIVENSTEFILGRPRQIDHLQSSDIDSMFSKMDQQTVCTNVTTELRFAANTAGANAFYIVLYDTVNGNHADEACWFDANQGPDPTTHLPPDLQRPTRGVAYSIDRVCQLLNFLVHNSYVTLGDSVQHQVKGIPQGGHASSLMANLTCYFFEKRFVEENPFHSLQFNIFRFCDDFNIANTPYFVHMYRDIYPESSGIVLIINITVPRQGRLFECHFLDTLTYKTADGELHITLFDKRSSYNFEINRFPDVFSNVSRIQSHSVYFGELVRMFRINTHVTGFLQNSAETAAYLIVKKHYSRTTLTKYFVRFIRSQLSISNPRLPGTENSLKQSFEGFLKDEIRSLM